VARLGDPATKIPSPRVAVVGMIQFGLGLLHLTTGARLVTAIRSSLIGGLQIPLAPAWVGSPSARCPKFATCVGCLVVVTTHRERSGDQAG